MSKCVFLRVLDVQAKSAVLLETVASLRHGDPVQDRVFERELEAFQQLPRSPFAYWASERVIRLFADLSPLGGNGRSLKQGIATADDFRFARAWWEVDPQGALTGTMDMTPSDFRRATFRGKKWVPLAKGGEYSPYYADLHLVVNWENDGAELRAFPKSYIRNPDFYFRPGMTWASRPLGRGAFGVLPKGAAFSVSGMACFGGQPLELCAIANSGPFLALLNTLMPRGTHGSTTLKYEIGYVGSVPIPGNLLGSSQLRSLAAEANALSRMYLSQYETSISFRTLKMNPADGSLWATAERLAAQGRELLLALDRVQTQIDGLVRGGYGLEAEDFASLEASVPPMRRMLSPASPRDHLLGILQYTFGLLFGRWDIRLATGDRPLPELPDPFAPLPVCSPGMLQGPDGLPAKPEDVPSDYPVPIQWDGIIPDDPGHPEDLITLLHQVFRTLFPGRDPLEVEHEACQVLGVDDLRTWFRNEFFPYHIKRYTKSRRKAPIYWQLRSASKNYSIWLYYHRLTADTLWKVLRGYVEPKISHEKRRLSDLEADLEKAKASRAGAIERELARRISDQRALLEELVRFQSDVREVADMGYEPDRDDGVIINIAPLHKVVPWKDAGLMWKELQAGKYPWSTMAKRLKHAQGNH